MVRDAIGGDRRVVEVGAVIKPIDAGADQGKIARHPIVQLSYVFLAEESARDAGLIGYDNDIKSGVIGQFDGVSRAFDPFKILDAMNEAVVNVQHAVTVKENRSAFWRGIAHGVSTTSCAIRPAMESSSMSNGA